MPIYHYRPDPSPCKICGKGFDHSQRASEADLTECPTCGLAVVKELPSGIASPKILRKPSISQAKQAGFTVLKKIGTGEYERQ
jgi:putative FmdB family regulatory protein